jgi:hypothetical protein
MCKLNDLRAHLDACHVEPDIKDSVEANRMEEDNNYIIMCPYAMYGRDEREEETNEQLRKR